MIDDFDPIEHARRVLASLNDCTGLAIEHGIAAPVVDEQARRELETVAAGGFDRIAAICKLIRALPQITTEQARVTGAVAALKRVEFSTVDSGTNMRH